MGSDKAIFAEHVWVAFKDPQNNTLIVRGCIVVRKQRNNSLLVRDLDGKESWVEHSSVLGVMHSGSLAPVEDMAELDDLQEHSVLHNLHLRYSKKLIYTYIGTMLVAVNPYENLPLYTQEMIRMYNNKNIGDLPPHIFAIADKAFTSMTVHSQNQSIVISGESGAGKTESTRIILEYLVSKCGQRSPVQRQILDANIILENFGNAKTVCNNNSSRFGKFIDVTFNGHGNIDGARIEHYLLEKSRIVFQNQGERNYHVFYSLLNGLTKEEKKTLNLGDIAEYKYLANTEKRNSQEDQLDGTMFHKLRQAMSILRFTNEEIWEIFNLLAMILHMGNMKYKRLNINNMEASELSDSIHVTKVANILGVSKSILTSSLTKRTILVNGERVISGISKEQALVVRDTFVKTVYGKLFTMLINKINHIISNKNHTKRASIGVLDIFGFENFHSNSFEQLCINYANESLQQFFVKHIFKLEQECYIKEGLDWQKIDFVDNEEVLNVIGNKYVNIFALIDEETKFPKGTDLTLLSKLHSAHGNKSIYLKPKSDTKPSFGIRHFAGPVYYDVQGFLEKNRDSFNLDLQFLVVKSGNRFLNYIFNSEEPGSDSVNQKRVYTLASQFKDSLDELLKTLNTCNPFFIRCIKPNEYKKSMHFDAMTCLRQLRYSGLMDTAKVRKAGYSIRLTYLEFSKRYLLLIHGSPKRFNSHGIAEQICKEHLSKLSARAAFLGHSKVFLKREAEIVLEEKLVRSYHARAVIVQNTIRMWLCRKRYLKLRRSVIVLKNNWKTRQIRKEYQSMKFAITRLQSRIISRRCEFRYKLLKRHIFMFQAHCRGFMIRRWTLQKLLQKKQKKIMEKIKFERNNMFPERQQSFIDSSPSEETVHRVREEYRRIQEDRRNKKPINVQNMKPVIEELNFIQKIDRNSKFHHTQQSNKINNMKYQPPPEKSIPNNIELKRAKSNLDVSRNNKTDDNLEQKLLFIGNKLNVRPKTFIESPSSKPYINADQNNEKRIVNSNQNIDSSKELLNKIPYSYGATQKPVFNRPGDSTEPIQYVDKVFNFLNDASNTNTNTSNVRPTPKNVNPMSKFFNTFRKNNGSRDPIPIPRKYKPINS